MIKLGLCQRACSNFDSSFKELESIMDIGGIKSTDIVILSLISEYLNIGGFALQVSKVKVKYCF